MSLAGLSGDIVRSTRSLVDRPEIESINIKIVLNYCYRRRGEGR